MILRITTPNGSDPNRRYDPRYDFLTHYARLCHIPVTRLDTMTSLVSRGPFYRHSLGFYSMTLTTEHMQDKQVIIDFSDLTTEGIVREYAEKQKAPVIKMHYFPEYVAPWKHTYPGGSWMDIRSEELFQTFLRMQKETVYTCNTDIVLNNQSAHSRALERRKKVQDYLKFHYKKDADCSYEFENQLFFWKKFQSCLVSVVVGGACDHMIDRGHMEQLALGVCTIFSGHTDLFAGRAKLQPWKHYIPVLKDYSNLKERIEWCKDHREECRVIGVNAKKFWEQYCSPSSYLSHLEAAVHEHYETIKE